MNTGGENLCPPYENLRALYTAMHSTAEVCSCRQAFSFAKKYLAHFSHKNNSNKG